MGKTIEISKVELPRCRTEGGAKQHQTRIAVLLRDFPSDTPTSRDMESWLSGVSMWKDWSFRNILEFFCGAVFDVCVLVLHCSTNLTICFHVLLMFWYLCFYLALMMILLLLFLLLLLCCHVVFASVSSPLQFDWLLFSVGFGVVMKQSVYSDGWGCWSCLRWCYANVCWYWHCCWLCCRMPL